MSFFLRKYCSECKKMMQEAPCPQILFKALKDKGEAAGANLYAFTEGDKSILAKEGVCSDCFDKAIEGVAEMIATVVIMKIITDRKDDGKPDSEPKDQNAPGSSAVH